MRLSSMDEYARRVTNFARSFLRYQQIIGIDRMICFFVASDEVSTYLKLSKSPKNRTRLV